MDWLWEDQNKKSNMVITHEGKLVQFINPIHYYEAIGVQAKSEDKQNAQIKFIYL